MSGGQYSLLHAPSLSIKQTHYIDRIRGCKRIMKFASTACVLALLLTVKGGNSSSNCRDNGDTRLLETVRQSACTLNRNRKEGDAFKAHIRFKHGVDSRPCKLHAVQIQSNTKLVNIVSHIYATAPASASSYLFHHTTSRVWCRTGCQNYTSQNVTWCVNIGYTDGEVETCITAGNGSKQIITNSSCEAETIGLSDYLSLPSVRFLLILLILYYLSHYVFRIALAMAILVAWGLLTWTGSSSLHI